MSKGVLSLVTDVAGFDAAWPVLGRASGRPDRDRPRLMALYIGAQASARLYEMGSRETPSGVIGVRAGEILHIAVREEQEGRGLGRLMAEVVREIYPGVRLWVAETDDAAIGFYRRLGFGAEVLPPRYPGVTRYRVSWTAPPGTRV